MPNTKRRILVLAGPTASGKTAMAIRICLQLGGEIVGADSVQVYRRLDIGSAKPTAEERSQVPHHGIDLVEPDEMFSVGAYQHWALACIDGILARGKVPVVVGGTGLYIRSLTNGLFEGPAADLELRRRLEATEDANPGMLHGRLHEVDPETAARLHPRDRVRLVRALEVYEKTGLPISEHHRRHAVQPPPCKSLMFVLDPPREELSARIRIRAQKMLQDGFVEEVQNLLNQYSPDLRSLQSVGYREVVDTLVRGATRQDLEDRIVRAHEKYVRQQRTWFRDLPEHVWPVENISLETLERFLAV